MTDLFAASGLDKSGPRPLADRLRPTTLAEVAGQEHLTGPEGALTRLVQSGSLGSLIFWGPPGTGKTTVARLLAGQVDLGFEQISAIFSGIADLKKVFESARGRRLGGKGTLLFVDEIHRYFVLPVKSNSVLYLNGLLLIIYRKAVLGRSAPRLEYMRKMECSIVDEHVAIR